MYQDITFYDYEIRDVDAWEGRGTPIQVSLDVTESLGTGLHGTTVSLSTDEGLSFAVDGLGDGLKDPSVRFLASLDDANSAISALTLHTTAAPGAVAASGVLTLGACDSGRWIEAEEAEAGSGSRDWGDYCRDEGRAEQNVTFGYRMGTMPVIESLRPIAAPIGGGLTLEVTDRGRHFLYGSKVARCHGGI